MSNKTDHSTTVVKDNFPYQHRIDEDNKIIYIYWEGNGQLGRYGVPYNMKKFYPEYSYKFSNKENI
jgi:hypothetical protein